MCIEEAYFGDAAFSANASVFSIARQRIPCFLCSAGYTNFKAPPIEYRNYREASSISGLVVEYIVAIDVTRVRFPADAFFVALVDMPC